MITITAPGKGAQQHCEWLRPRGLEGCIMQVPPVVKLRHSKMVVIVDSIHGSNQSVVACIRPHIALFGVFFPRKDPLEKRVWMACFVVAVVLDSVAVVVCRSSASGRVGT